MANNTTNIDVLIQNQSSKEVTVNAFFDAASQAVTYGRRQSTCSGLTWGYYGGNVVTTGGGVQMANGTLVLTANATNYIVASKADGVVSASTTTTNWDNENDYWQLYGVTTGPATATSWTDVRRVALFTMGATADPLNSDNITEGSVNLFFTAARVRDAVLTGLSTATNAVITATDTVLSAFGKLQRQFSDHTSQASVHAISAVTDLQTTLDGKTRMTGFPVDANGNYLCSLTYNETTRTVTITPTGADFKIYSNGVEYVQTGVKSIQHGTQQGGHFIYFNTSGVLVTGQTPWDLLDDVPVSYVFWDATNSRGLPFEERHHAGRDVYWHRNQHAAEGTKVTGTGFSATGYTLSSGATDADVTYAVAAGRVEDEDIIVDTQVLPDAGPYTILHRSGASGDWLIDRSSVLPFRYATNQLQYNQFTGATWQLTGVTEDQFVNYWVFALTAMPTADITPSPTTTQQVIIIPGQAIHATEALANAESVSSLAWGAMPFQEIAPLYQVTLRYNAAPPSAFTNTARCAIVRVARVVGTTASITQTAQTDHVALTGLTDDDHPQYYNDARGDLRYSQMAAANTFTAAQVVSVNSALPALTVTQAGGGYALLVEDQASDTTPILITDAGRLLVGTTVGASFPLSSSTLQSIKTQFAGASQGDAAIALASFSTTSTIAPNIAMARSRGALNAQALVVSGDSLGRIVALGSDGQAEGTNAGFLRAAVIEAQVDGTAAAGSMPGRWVISTTPSGSPSPVERVRIDNAGAIVHQSNANTIVDSSSHLGLRSYTVATLPAATAQRLIYVSNGTANKRLAVSDGTNWRWPDGAIVS